MFAVGMRPSGWLADLLDFVSLDQHGGGRKYIAGARIEQPFGFDQSKGGRRLTEQLGKPAKRCE